MNKPDFSMVQTRVARLSLGDRSCTVRVHRSRGMQLWGKVATCLGGSKM